MKVYVHCDVEPSFTKVLRVQPDRHVTLADLVTDFLTAYRDKHGASVKPSLTLSSVQVRRACTPTPARYSQPLAQACGAACLQPGRKPVLHTHKPD